MMDIAPEYTVEYAEKEIVRLMPSGGLELRDFFAAHALSGLLARGEKDDVTGRAYAIAERMVETRRRGDS